MTTRFDCQGALTQLAPGFDIVAEARRFAAEQFSPDVLRKTVTDELIALLPMLRCLLRRINRISGALEASGIMAVLMLGLHGGPSITRTMSLYAFFDYCLLVVAAILAVRVLVLVFRPDTS